jgi:hypothetical protein
VWQADLVYKNELFKAGVACLQTICFGGFYETPGKQNIPSCGSRHPAHSSAYFMRFSFSERGKR